MNNFMGRTRLFSFIWFLIFVALYAFFDSKDWSVLSIIALIMASLSFYTLIRTFIFF